MAKREKQQKRTADGSASMQKVFIHGSREIKIRLATNLKKQKEWNRNGIKGRVIMGGRQRFSDGESIIISIDDTLSIIKCYALINDEHIVICTDSEKTRKICIKYHCVFLISLFFLPRRRFIKIN